MHLRHMSFAEAASPIPLNEVHTNLQMCITTNCLQLDLGHLLFQDV